MCQSGAGTGGYGDRVWPWGAYLPHEWLTSRSAVLPGGRERHGGGRLTGNYLNGILAVNESAPTTCLLLDLPKYRRGRAKTSLRERAPYAEAGIARSRATIIASRMRASPFTEDISSEAFLTRPTGTARRSRRYDPSTTAFWQRRSRSHHGRLRQYRCGARSGPALVSTKVG